MLYPPELRARLEAPLAGPAARGARIIRKCLTERQFPRYLPPRQVQGCVAAAPGGGCGMRPLCYTDVLARCRFVKSTPATLPPAEPATSSPTATKAAAAAIGVLRTDPPTAYELALSELRR